MNEITKKVRTRFARDVRFDVKTTPFRAEQTTELEKLKNRLLKQLLDEAPDADQNVLLRRAANDAAALVWVTGCPLLLFPALLEEKVRAALDSSASARSRSAGAARTSCSKPHERPMASTHGRHGGESFPRTTHRARKRFLIMSLGCAGDRSGWRRINAG